MNEKLRRLKNYLQWMDIERKFCKGMLDPATKIKGWNEMHLKHYYKHLHFHISNRNLE